jgi:hypothetical protein
MCPTEVAIRGRLGTHAADVRNIQRIAAAQGGEVILDPTFTPQLADSLRHGCAKSKCLDEQLCRHFGYWRCRPMAVDGSW